MLPSPELNYKFVYKESKHLKALGDTVWNISFIGLWKQQEVGKIKTHIDNQYSSPDSHTPLNNLTVGLQRKYFSLLIQKPSMFPPVQSIMQGKTETSIVYRVYISKQLKIYPSSLKGWFRTGGSLSWELNPPFQFPLKRKQSKAAFSLLILLNNSAFLCCILFH